MCDIAREELDLQPAAVPRLLVAVPEHVIPVQHWLDDCLVPHTQQHPVLIDPAPESGWAVK